MFKRFISDETGAVTVDWTVITAAIVGLGIASSSLISNGIKDLAGDVNQQLNATNIYSGFARTLASIDFSNGLSGWAGASVRDLGGQIGEALYIDQQQTAAITFDLPPGTQEAVMAFALYGGDTLDGEDAIVSVGGVPVVIATGYHGRMSIDIPQVDGTTVKADVVVEQVNLGSGGLYVNAGDSKALVSITVQDPGDDISLSVYSNNSHGTNGDEWWAVDDVTLNAR